MEYQMKGDYVLTDEDFNRLGEAAERGDYPGGPGEWIVRPQGRPQLDSSHDVRKNVPGNTTKEVVSMVSVDITTARQNLHRLVKEVNAFHSPIQILGKEGNAVLISADDWRFLEETLHLCSAADLVEAIKESENEPVEDMISADELNWG